MPNSIKNLNQSWNNNTTNTRFQNEILKVYNPANAVSVITDASAPHTNNIQNNIRNFVSDTRTFNKAINVDTRDLKNKVSLNAIPLKVIRREQLCVQTILFCH